MTSMRELWDGVAGMVRSMSFCHVVRACRAGVECVVPVPVGWSVRYESTGPSRYLSRSRLASLASGCGVAELGGVESVFGS